MNSYPELDRYQAELRSILALKVPESDKVAQAFALVTSRVLEGAHRDIELARALGDAELKVKHQIKKETIESVRRIYQMCHLQVTGRKAWDE